MQRRDFLKQTAAAATALAVTESVRAAQQEQPQPIIDTHVHLWDLTRFRLPWITKDSPLARSYVMKDYQTATQGLNVVKGVYMEVDVEVKQQKDEGDYVLDICPARRYAPGRAVISGRPADEGFRKYLESFKGNRSSKASARSCTSRRRRPAFARAPNSSAASASSKKWDSARPVHASRRPGRRRPPGRDVSEDALHPGPTAATAPPAPAPTARNGSATWIAWLATKT